MACGNALYVASRPTRSPIWNAMWRLSTYRLRVGNAVFVTSIVQVKMRIMFISTGIIKANRCILSNNKSCSHNFSFTDLFIGLYSCLVTSCFLKLLFTFCFITICIYAQIYWTKFRPRWLRSLEVGSAGSVLSTASTPQLCGDTLKQSTWLILSTVVMFAGNFAQLLMHLNVIKRNIFWSFIRMKVILKWR